MSFTISWSLLKLMSIGLVMPSYHLILCCPLLLLPLIFPSIRDFSNDLALRIKYWSFSFSISPSNEHSRLISFRIDWFDLAVQGTLESSPASLFESIDSSMFSLLYGPTLTSIDDYRKNHSFDSTDLCRQSDVCILIRCLGINTLSRASLVAQMVKNPPAIWETWVRCLGWEDPLEKGTASHSSILAWKIL